MVICSFSGEEIPKGTGKMYVKKDGKILYFLNSKCQKNYLNLGRKPRKITWTAEYRAEKTKRVSLLKEAEKTSKTTPKVAVKESSKAKK